MAITYRALHLLTTDCKPLYRGREPYWHAPVTSRQAAIGEKLILPSWSWKSPLLTTEEESYGTGITLDANAAYLSAASSVRVAHSRLTHHGPAMATDTPAPGYYQIDAHPWPDSRIVSPLGTSVPSDTARIWVAHPTLTLLAQLTADGKWPDCRIYDSWGPDPMHPETVRLNRWTTTVREHRIAMLARLTRDPGDQEAAEGYRAIKDGYSIAIQIMLSGTIQGKRAPLHRPDWYYAIHAQHAASTWRKTWRALQAGIPPLAMGGVDELTYRLVDYSRLAGGCDAKGLPTIDPTGFRLGAFRIKKAAVRQEAVAGVTGVLPGLTSRLGPDADLPDDEDEGGWDQPGPLDACDESPCHCSGHGQ